jgi:hypothetical protein
MFANLPLALQAALAMVAVFDGLLAFLLVLNLLYLGYIKGSPTMGGLWIRK